MSKLPSEATQLRRLKSDHKLLKKEFYQVRVDRDAYRARATRMEQEVAQWRERFDILLRREDKL
ncbi:MAG: hypothetical protein NUV75_02065 [Gallionella sp.]|nr:hypothetical protein [Gallionella sp.]